ncbi:MAG: NFACT RNA binding domain-containing protein [Campylobacterales bacterium]|nr:NFACT RNA binding domain-containing protein [Campylobacterales bacterium]
MKYYILKELTKYLNENCTAIKLIKRVENNTILIDFNNRNTIYFDLSKGNSLVYKKNDEAYAKKDFSAPFDTLLKKRFYNAKIENITLHNDDKIIRFYLRTKSSYKEEISILQLEFTGKHTNIVITDDKLIVLEALRHIDEFSSSRVVKVGELLEEVPKQSFVPKIEKIEDLETLLYETYAKKENQSLEILKKVKLTNLEKNLRKIEKLLTVLPKEEELNDEAKDLYEKGNLILNNLYLIKAYQKEIEVYNNEGELVTLIMDNNESSPSVYGNKLFKLAKKTKRKAFSISIEKNNLEEKLSFLKRMIVNIKSAKNIDECEFLMPKKEKNQKRTKKEQPYESFFFNGFKIMLGRSERENVFLLQNSKASDFWFHLKDRPSAHVIVQNSKKTIPDDVIEKAAILCAKFSLDYEGRYEVDYTQRRNVNIQSGANVLYNPYTTTIINF